MPDKSRKWRFHLTGGALCLDFANTLSWRRGRTAIERLGGYEDLIAFGLQSGIIDQAEARALRNSCSRKPRRAVKVYKEALELRALIDRIFTKIVEGQVGDRSDLAALNERVAKVTARMRIVPNRRAYIWQDTGEVLDGMLTPIVRSAATLLTSVELAKLHRCAADDCGWLFVDLSRNQRRRWCDMLVCGNRAKARRHYDRARQAPASHIGIKRNQLYGRS